MSIDSVYADYMGPATYVDATATVQQISNCASLQQSWTAEASQIPAVKTEIEAATIIFMAAQTQLINKQQKLMSITSKLLEIAGKINAIPGCALPK